MRKTISAPARSGAHGYLTQPGAARVSPKNRKENRIFIIELRLQLENEYNENEQKSGKGIRETKVALIKM